MNHGLSNCSGSIAAWLCLGSVAFVHEPLSMPNTLALTFAPVHYIANFSLLLIWITGGIFLIAYELLAFVPFRFRA